MQFGMPYPMGEVIDTQRRQHERALSERRALESEEPRGVRFGRFRGGFRRLDGGFARLRRLAPERPAVTYGTRVLTGKACRLADGSVGQVAIHESDGEWVEVCVPA